MTPRHWKLAALISLALVVGLSLFGGRTALKLGKVTAALDISETQLAETRTQLREALWVADSLYRVAGRSEVVYRDRLRQLPPDTVLIGLPAACDACVKRSRAQDSALVAADSTIARKDRAYKALFTSADSTVRELGELETELREVRAQLARVAVTPADGTRRIFGVPLPSVFAGYGVSFNGSAQTGPVVGLGWKVDF